MTTTMTEAWWKANINVGKDSRSQYFDVTSAVTAALTNWDTKVRNVAMSLWTQTYIDHEIIPCLNTIVTESTECKTRISIVLNHQKTVGIIDKYVEICTNLIRNMHTETGAYWTAQFKTGSISDVDIALIKKMDAHWWPMKMNDFGFLKAMKTSSNYGSEEAYQTYILGTSSDHVAVTVEPSIKARITAARKEHHFRPADGWEDAKKGVLARCNQAGYFGDSMKLFHRKHLIMLALAQ